jgi:TonB family protein
MVKVAIYLAAFYCVYALMLSRDTFYGRNRAFIILASISAMLLPLFTLQTLKPMGIQFFGKILSEVFVSASRTGSTNPGETTSAPSLLQIIYTIYITGVVLFLLKFIIDFINLLFLILRQKSAGSRIIRFHGFNTSGFSAMGFIFINTRLSPEEAGEIIRHEQNHLKNNHFVDIMFFEIFKSFQWFNPTVYLFDRSLRAIHEYQADEGCINSGVPVVNYQSLLLSQVFKSKAFNLTNSFSNPSLIKKRMVMMTKKRTSAIARMKLLLVLPAAAFVFFAISAYKEIPVAPVTKTIQLDPTVTTEPVSPSNAIINSEVKKQIKAEDMIAPPPPPPPPPSEKSSEKATEEVKTISEVLTEENEPEPFVVVEEMPMFPGGDVELLRYIGENTKYPEAAKEKNIQGRVIIRFCVTAKGSVSQLSVLKGVSPDLDAEALRVVGTLSGFNPGKQGGKPVPVWYMVPITFTLN